MAPRNANLARSGLQGGEVVRRRLSWAVVGDGGHDGLSGGRLAADDPLLGRAARARQRVPRARVLEQATRAGLRLRDGHRRPRAAEARELRAGAHQAEGRSSAHRSEQAPVRRHRPARRARPGHRRLQDRQRDRHRAQAGTPLLLRDVLSAAGAGADDRVGLRGRGRLPPQGERAPPAGRGSSLPDRQLPGRVGADDARRARPEGDRSRPARRLAALLLGRRRRQEPDALSRRPARGKLDGLARRRPRSRHVRRRPHRQQLREPRIRRTPTGASSTTSTPRSTASRRAFSSSRSGGEVTTS